MKRSTAVFVGAGLMMSTIIGLTGAGVAYGQEEPNCEQQRVELTAALQAVLELSPDVYPGDVVPTIEALPGLLDDILQDPQLGAGGRAEVEAAVRAQAALRECENDEPDYPTGNLPLCTIGGSALIAELERRLPAQAQEQVNRFSDFVTLMDENPETPTVDIPGTQEALIVSQLAAHQRNECDDDPTVTPTPTRAPEPRDDDQDDVVPDTSNGVATGVA